MNINDFLKSLGVGKEDDLAPQLIELLRKQIEIAEKNNNHIMSLRKEVDNLAHMIAGFHSRLDQFSKMYSDIDAARLKECSHNAEEAVVSTIEDKSETVQVPKAQVVRTMYAIMIDELRLSVVSDADRSNAQFVITAKGDSGEVSFNPDSSAFCLGNIEGEVDPYFEYTLNSRSPVSIRSDNSSKVTLASDGCWIMDRPIHLTID